MLSTAYFPPIEYFSAIAHARTAWVEGEEAYLKQSYRTRCHIYAAGGRETLQVPVCHGPSKLIRDIRIDYTHPWLHQHTIAIKSAYGASPFFMYYWDDIERLLHQGHKYLFDLNMDLTRHLISVLGISTPVESTSEFCAEWRGEDLRGAMHPKRKCPSLYERHVSDKPYYQVFSDRAGFIPNLSILDLVFHEGPESADYL